jgi:peptide/nickel transport system substrate-binding protein
VLTILAGDVTLNQVAQLLQQQAKAIGLTLKIRPLHSIQYSEATSSAKARQGTDLLMAISFNVAADPLEPVPFNVMPGSFYNYTNYENPEVTRLINEAKQTFDAKARTALMVKAQSIYEQNPTTAVLVELNEISYLNKKFSGMTTSFAYMNTPSLASIGAAG